MAQLGIEIVSDVICPWCFIGTRRLDQALATLPATVPVEVTYRPFLLEPNVPREGADLRERLRAKYGVDPERLFARVEAAARESGIALDFTKIRRTPNTIAAHTLLRRALAKGTQRALAGALFEAYFLAGRDVGDPPVLTDIAGEHGFDAGEVTRVLGDEDEQAATRREARAAAEAGVSGVPFFIFGGRFAVGGAQPTDVLRQAIDRALLDGAPAA
jgi:predicted DsbA family dithiol-disulfide isomerase